MKPGARYERCEQCGSVWNVSAGAQFWAGVYICPACEKKNRGASRGKKEKRLYEK